jgi:hypothetical protein
MQTSNAAATIRLLLGRIASLVLKTAVTLEAHNICKRDQAVLRSQHRCSCGESWNAGRHFRSTPRDRLIGVLLLSY